MDRLVILLELELNMMTQQITVMMLHYIFLLKNILYYRTVVDILV